MKATSAELEARIAVLERAAQVVLDFLKELESSDYLLPDGEAAIWMLRAKLLTALGHIDHDSNEFYTTGCPACPGAQGVMVVKE